MNERAKGNVSPVVRCCSQSEPAGHAEARPSHFVNDASDSLLWQPTLPSHVQLAPQVPFCNWSALQGSAPARPTPPPQTCCTDVKTFLLLLLFLAGWGNVYLYLFPFGLKAFDNYVLLSLSFSLLFFFPDHMWLVEGKKMKNKQTCVYQCYNMKVTFCQIPFQMKAFFVFI